MVKTKQQISKQKKTIKKKPTVEYEARFLDIEPDQLITKIKEVGGSLKKPLTLFKRSVFSLCDISKGYVRVRDEGNKVTMTSKIYKDPKFPQESELEINNTFEEGQTFLRSLNLHEKAYHETMRETWSIIRNKKELCEIAIDRIPGLPTYAEVECKSERDLKQCIKLLHLENKIITYGAYGNTFVHYYGMSAHEINNVVPKLTFQNIKNELKDYIHKNADILDKVADQHLDIYLSLKK
jgi:adenylate cyclase class 2